MSDVSRISKSKGTRSVRVIQEGGERVLVRKLGTKTTSDNDDDERMEEEEERRRSWKWNREGDEDGRLRESLDCARTDFTGLLATPRQTR